MNVVIEPDRDLLEWLQTALSIRGIEALHFGNPDEALARLETQGARMMLLDMDGLSREQSARLKQFVQDSHTPVCAITGSGGDDGDGGFFDTLLTKPFSIDDVIKAVKELASAASIIETAAERSETGNGGNPGK